MFVFIGGTPASGKTYTATRFIENATFPIHYVSIDKIREEEDFNDGKLKYWRDFFFNQKEKEYWVSMTYEKHMQNLIEQSEVFWPFILDVIKKTRADSENAIIEGVNLIPHLVKKDIDFPGFYIIAENKEILYQRLKEDPRWGVTEDLQKLEAEYFVDWEARFIREEASKNGYKVFSESESVLKELQLLFQK